jgi:hypothetical protein
MRRALTAVVVAIAVAAGGTAPASAATPGCDALQLLNVTIDKSAMVYADRWTAVTESNAVWDPDGWHGDYSWTVPASIPKAGAPATLNVTATDKTGGRAALELDLSGNVAVDGGPAQATATADKTAGQPTASGSKTVTLVPGCYAAGSPIAVTVKVQDGPRITFNYKTVPAGGGGGACPTSASVFVAATCPAAPLGTTTRPIPGPGKTTTTSSPGTIPSSARTSDTSVTSSSGNLSDTTIVADAGAERRRRHGEAVAACWLIGPEVLDLPPDLKEAVRTKKVIDELNRQTAAQRLNVCILLVNRLGARFFSGSAARPAAGCRTIRLEITVRRDRRGRIISALASRKRGGSRDVRYSCKLGAAGSMVITADGRRPGGLRAGLGRKLDFGVYRDRFSSAVSGTMTFGFGV